MSTAGGSAGSSTHLATSGRSACLWEPGPRAKRRAKIEAEQPPTRPKPTTEDGAFMEWQGSSRCDLLLERGSPLWLRKRDESQKKLLSLPQAKQAPGNLARDDQEADVQITRNGTETAAGPSEWFTGSVYIDAIVAPSNESRISASSVHFTPGSRTAWHTHPHGQTIWVSEGVGL